MRPACSARVAALGQPCLDRLRPALLAGEAGQDGPDMGASAVPLDQQPKRRGAAPAATASDIQPTVLHFAQAGAQGQGCALRCII